MILENRLAFVDIETTGFDRDTQEIIELGVVIAELRGDTLEVVDELDIKIRPKHIETADPQALRINGYTEADWLFATTLEEGMKSFVDKTKNAVFLAHNITFDYPFIEKALKDCRLENKMHFHKIDTLSVAFAKLYGKKEDINQLSLRKLCEYFGIENKKAHSAFADAYATYEMFKKLLDLK